MLKQFPKEVKFVYKEYPLPFHKDAMNASKAALAAHQQGKFWEMHDKIFANQRALSGDNLKQYAKDIGLDVAKFEKDMNSPEIQQHIEEDMKVARAADVQGTPTLFINGKRVMNRSPDALKTMIEEALKAKPAG